MFGDFPPSSSEIFFTVPAASRMICLPTSVLPVKAILSTSECLTSALPATEPGPGIQLNAPDGNPASIASSAIRMAVKGVSSAGFNTTVFPQASAGATFHAASEIGKFHGTIAPTTPNG